MRSSRVPETLLDRVPPLQRVLEAGTAGTYPLMIEAYERVRKVLRPSETALPRGASRVVAGPTLSGAIEPVSGAADVQANPVSQPALAAVQDLRRWLGISYEDVAGIAGYRSPSIIYYWRQRAFEGHEVRPRATTVGRLYRAHALVRAVAIALDGEEGVAGVQRWAHSEGEDGRTPLALLLQGKIAALYSRTGGVIFDQRPVSVPGWRQLRPEDDLEDEPDTREKGMRFGPDAFE
jgi:hypothetical protein